MARPRRCRRVASPPGFAFFKPAGVPGRALPEIVLNVDEYEALRLADHERLYHQQAAQHMGVSRQTFGRIVDSARKKVARALVEGMALRIQGGNVEVARTRVFECDQCGHTWEVPFGTGRPAGCPGCHGSAVRRFHNPAATAGDTREKKPKSDPAQGGISPKPGGSQSTNGRRAIIETEAGETATNTGSEK